MINNQIGKKQNESCPSKCRRVFTWMFQLAVWAGIVLVIISNSNKSMKDLITTGWVVFGVSYFFYVILELCSSTFSYLNNISQSVSIHEYMRGLFHTPITITFHVECYHYVTVVQRTNNSTSVRREKRVTYTGSQNFVYYSWKDISGVFLLDSTEAVRNDNIVFIKLQLEQQYRLFDNFTANDLNIQRNNFFISNRWRDQYMDTNTTSSLNGLKEFNLVRISDKEVTMIGCGWFFLFTILTMSQFYKYYVDKYCSSQLFTIVKEISTRINLNAPYLQSRYEVSAPKILLRGETKNYGFEPELLHNTPVAPNENDLLPNENNKEWVNTIPSEDDINRNIQNNQPGQAQTQGYDPFAQQGGYSNLPVDVNFSNNNYNSNLVNQNQYQQNQQNYYNQYQNQQQRYN